jgi:hypothetical protein
MKIRLRFIREQTARWLKGWTPMLYHVLVVVLSAAFAFSLPFVATLVAKKALSYWSLVGNDRVFLVSIEVGSAVLLILLLGHVRRSWKDRKAARMANKAGLVLVCPANGMIARRRIRKLKAKQGFARDAMIIASTGYRTFVEERGELSEVLENCREAKIMLLHPDSEGAEVRAKSLGVHENMEGFKEQIRMSISLLKDLKSKHRNVRLKLYQDAPFLKMAVLGDHLWVQYYHPRIESQDMPKYVFEDTQDRGALFTPFYQYFLSRWHNTAIPEYDLDRDELVFRDSTGREIGRGVLFTGFESPLSEENASALGSRS